MIITLKGADFSADNIGQVELERTLNAYTLAAIEASGNTGMTDTQKFALDDLFIAMGVDGSNNVMSKIRKLYIPMLATEVANALINYADNTFTKDATPNPANWELRNLGIAQKASGQNFSLTLDNPLDGTNFTQIWLRTENMVSGVNDSCISFILRGKTDTTKFLGLGDNSASGNNGIQWGSYGYQNFKYYLKSGEQRVATGCTIRSLSDTSIKAFTTDVEKITLTLSVGDMSGETSQTMYLLGLNDQRAPKPYGLFLIGESITEAQFTNILSKIDALYSAMKG